MFRFGLNTVNRIKVDTHGEENKCLFFPDALLSQLMISDNTDVITQKEKHLADLI